MKSTARYEILEEIGRGGMGVVYRARDLRQGIEVALKTLLRPEPAEILRFKQEFRGPDGVSHPNLVTLYGLEEMNGQWVISMELVHGVDFLAYVRPGLSRRRAAPPGSGLLPDITSEAVTLGAVEPAEAGDAPATAEAHVPVEPLGPEGEGRLRHGLRQIAQALHALHSAGKLHCDVKPSNVLVTPEGRVVVLDFGLVTDLVPSPFARYLRRDVAGTEAYMAPEQLRPGPLSPASDWYAFGVLLYQALTGRLPFEGNPYAIMMAKLQREPAPPGQIAAGVPEDLARLCVDLLRRKPLERPDAPEVFTALGLPWDPVDPVPAPVFVGREAELAALHEMFEAVRSGRAVTALLHGESGIGKSALVRHCLERLERGSELVVLEGRCHESESVPYKALDSLIDRLSQYLDRLAPEEVSALLPEDAHLLGRAFPVLGDSGPGLAEEPEPRELRRRVFAALRQLFGRLAARAPLVLFIDDLQWGDMDSAALLAEVFAQPAPPPIWLIACCRSEDIEAAPALRSLLERWSGPLPGHDVHLMSLGALGAGDMRELAGSILAGAGPTSPALLDSIASEAGGSPLFAQELATYALMTGPDSGAAASIVRDDVVRHRIGLLESEERRLLEVLSIAGHPVDEAAAGHAAGPASSGRRAVSRLRTLHLISRRSQGLLEPYHDHIRRAVAAALTPEAKRGHHLALARALEALPDVEPEIVANHYREGGALELAARYTVLAADRAVAALAFSRAADLYRSALKAGPGAGQAWELMAKLAEALANAGKGSEAAVTFAGAARELEARSPGDLTALDLRRRAAEHYLRSGHIDKGVALLRKVFAQIGAEYPATLSGAVLMLVTQRMELGWRGVRYKLRDPSEVSPRDRLRVEVYWSAGLGLSMVDSMRAALFQVCHELAALKLGEPVNVARGLCSEVATRASEGGAENRRRCGEVLKVAESLAGRLKDPAISMLAHFCAGTAAYFAGRWSAAVERLRAAQEIGRSRCVGVTWEMNSAQVMELWALAYRGELRELSARAPQLLKEARDRDDVFAETGLLLGLPNMIWLARDQPDLADEHAAAAMRRWTSSGFHSQHYFALVARAQTALYRGGGAGAHQIVEEAWPKLGRAMLLRLQAIRIELRYLRARAALAAAAAVPSREALVHLVKKERSRIAREDMPLAAPLTALIVAGLWALRGDRRGAAARLDQAAMAFDTLDMGLYAAAARLQRGRLVRGEPDAEAWAWMERQGIAAPERMAEMLVPLRFA